LIEIMLGRITNAVDKIPAIECESWSSRAQVHILDREAARLAAVEQPATIDLYTDDSVRSGRAGIDLDISVGQ
jgi:hypothetical protein